VTPDDAAPVATLDLDALHRWPMPVDQDGDKYARGTALVIAGSAFTPGAAILAGMAALRMGAGRLQIATDVSTVANVAVAVPEALVLPMADASGEPSAEVLDRVEQAQCVLVGPGLLDAELSRRVVAAVIGAAAPDSVVVLDANALDAVCDIGPSALVPVRGRLVLTPNRQELSMLSGALGGDAGTRLPPDQWSDADESDIVAVVARAAGAVVTCFADVAAHDGRRWRSGAGHPGLGTSGSGDVLAGLVAGVAARTGDAAQAACWGTLAHQLSGQRLGEQCSPLGFLARELIDAVVPAIAGSGDSG
jgi:ADP-dependent NAD(P)H-hydrate dehydratase